MSFLDVLGNILLSMSLGTLIVVSFINVTNPSFLLIINRALLVTISDMLTVDKEYGFNILSVASYSYIDMVVSFSGSKESISSVTFYLSSIPLIKMADGAQFVASVLSSITKV